MYCTNCGNQINDNAVICTKCGAATPNFGAAGKTAEPKKESNVLALVGFILSFFLPVAGLVCSIIGYKRCKNDGVEGKNLALAGIIISTVFIAISLIVVILMIIAMFYLVVYDVIWGIFALMFI